MIMEFVNGKSLQDIMDEYATLTNPPEEKIVNIFRSIFDALSYLASQGIMHRDLKPENILIERKTGKVKIIDFGLAAKFNEGELLYTSCGSPGYIAPEVFDFDFRNSGTAYNDRVDVFSIGCILFGM